VYRSDSRRYLGIVVGMGVVGLWPLLVADAAVARVAGGLFVFTFPLQLWLLAAMRITGGDGAVSVRRLWRERTTAGSSGSAASSVSGDIWEVIPDKSHPAEWWTPRSVAIS
jgi:hypothetical protein